MKILIAGDSMIKYLPQYISSHEELEIHIKAYPGYGIKRLTSELNGTDGYDAIFLHIGTNDTYRESKDSIVSDYLELIHTLRKKNDAVILLSEILPRAHNNFLMKRRQNFQLLNLIAERVNGELKDLSKDSKDIKYISANANWAEYLGYDGVHLSRNGNEYLAKFFEKEILNLNEGNTSEATDIVKEDFDIKVNKVEINSDAVLTTYASALKKGLKSEKSGSQEKENTVSPQIATAETICKTITECTVNHGSEVALKVNEAWTIVKSRKRNKRDVNKREIVQTRAKDNFKGLDCPVSDIQKTDQKSVEEAGKVIASEESDFKGCDSPVSDTKKANKKSVKKAGKVTASERNDFKESDYPVGDAQKTNKKSVEAAGKVTESEGNDFKRSDSPVGDTLKTDKKGVEEAGKVIASEENDFKGSDSPVSDTKKANKKSVKKAGKVTASGRNDLKGSDSPVGDTRKANKKSAKKAGKVTASERNDFKGYDSPVGDTQKENTIKVQKTGKVTSASAKGNFKGSDFPVDDTQRRNMKIFKTSDKCCFAEVETPVHNSQCRNLKTLRVVPTNVESNDYDSETDTSFSDSKGKINSRYNPQVKLMSGGSGHNFKKICAVCKKCYYSSASFSNHRKNCSNVSIPDSITIENNQSSIKSLFQCFNCSRQFQFLSKLNSHISKCELLRHKCPLLECNQKFRCASQSFEHAEEAHGFSSNFLQLHFEDIQSFQLWLDKESTSTYSSFKSDSSKCKGDIKYLYYSCQFFKREDSKVRITNQRNLKGVIPNNLDCPAKVIVHITSNGLNVKYFSLHNHELCPQNIKYQPIKKSVRELINLRLLEGVEKSKVLDIVRDYENNSSVVCKEYFLNNRHLKYYVNNVNKLSRVHEKDAVAVYILINSFMQGDNVHVLIYKPQDEDIVIGPASANKIPKSSLIIGFQTVQQREIMLKCSHKIVCIDSTHKTNEYNFYLINLVVPDEYGYGYAVAHFILNTLDEASISCCFDSLNESLAKSEQKLILNAVMTDDDKTTGPAFLKVFGSHIHHLLCLWHLHRSWKNKLNSLVINPEVRNKIYSYLVVLLEQRDKLKFKMMKENFISEFQNSEPKFIKYFVDYYSEREELWSMAYRQFPHAFTDTNMYCESFHNKLKTHYLKGKFNRRVDVLIDTLLKIDKDAYRDTKYREITGCPKSNYPQAYFKRHDRGIKIDNEHVFEISEKSWFVQSQTNNDLFYEVEQIAEECTDYNHCDLKCIKQSCLSLCMHMYTCDCHDNHPLCKHIHKVHSLVSINFKPSDSKEDDFVDSKLSQSDELLSLADKKNEFCDVLSENNDLNLSFTSSSSSMNETASISETMTLISKLTDLIDNKNVKGSLIPYINRNLKALISACEGVKDSTNIHTKHFPLVSTPPNLLCKKQLTFKRTSAVRPLKRKALEYPSPSAKKQASASLALPQCSVDVDSNFSINSSLVSNSVVSSMSEDVFSDNKCSVMLKLNSSFTPNMKYVLNYNQVVLHIQNIPLHFYEIKSLDSYLSESEVAALVQVSPAFTKGWLYDSIIDAFTGEILMGSNSISVNVYQTQILKHGRSNTSLMATELLSAEFLFIPIYGDSHWVLLVAKLKEKEFDFYDPLGFNYLFKYSHFINLWRNHINYLLNSDDEWFVSYPQHILQRDSMNCGVFILYFIQKIFNRDNLIDDFNVNDFRRYIYSVICGNCLSNIAYSPSDSVDACVKCRQTHPHYK